jgi:hypothetical protein
MATSVIERQVVSADNDFTHNAPLDPGGNTPGPFAAAKTVKVRTCVTKGSGTTTGSVRRITMQPPAP